MHMTSARFSKSLPVASLAIASIISGHPIMAQDGRAVALEEIVVTAQRREASLQDTPIAISAFTETKLNDLGVFDVSQIGGFSPNVNIGKQPSSNSNMGVYIRGVGNSETSLLIDPKVGVYIDGVYISKTIGGVFDIVDLERIEVLRGAQGTLFGRNTTGGAINVTTKKPSGELSGRVDASIGNHGYARYGATLDLPLVGTLATKLSYTGMNTDGWARNRYNGAPQYPATKVERDLASADNDAYRIAVRWNPIEPLVLDYSYDKSHYKGVEAPFQITAVKNSLYNGFVTTPLDFQFVGGSLYQQMASVVGNPKKRKKTFNLDAVGKYGLDVRGQNLTVAFDASDDITFKYIYGSRKTDQGSATDLDGGAYTARDLFYGVYQGVNEEIPMMGYHGAITKGIVEMDSHELQVVGNAFEERLRYTGGIFYYKEDVEQALLSTIALPIAFIAPQGAYTPGLGSLYEDAGFCPPAYDGYLCIGTQRLPIPGVNDPGAPGLTDFEYGQHAKSWAAYGQGTFKVDEQLELTFGVRYTKDKKNAYMYNQDVAGLTVSSPARGRDTWDDVSYFLNGRYAITDSIGAYLSYATGYNGGGFNARATSAASFQAPFDREKVKTWELGLKSELFDKRLRLNIAIFTNDYKDIQIAQFEAGTGGASTRIVNAGSGTYRGIEFDVTAVPVDGFTVDFSYGYLNAKYDEYMAINPETDTLQDISARTTVANAPKNTAALGMQYDFIPFDFGALSARIDFVYKDKIVFHPFNNQYDTADSYALVNARISLNDLRLGCCGDGSLRVSLWGKNLTDKIYREWGIDFGSLGYAGNTFGEPRTYGLDIIYFFN